MSRKHLIALGVLFTVPLLTRGTEIGSIKWQARGLDFTKTDGQLIISWSRVSQKREADQIEVYDSQGNRLSSVKVLAAVEGAEKVSIWDVSARRDKRIAVAAYLVNKGGSVPALLYFNFKGSLLSATALAPSRAIRLLVLDDDLGAWALGMGAGGQNPSEVPLVVNFDPSGHIRKEIIKRAQFPSDAQILQEGRRVGSPAMGIDGDAIWIWLPGSAELVTIQKSDYSVARATTGLPDQAGSDVRELTRLIRLPSGVLIGEFAEKGAGFSHYKWSRESSTWEWVVPSDCGKHFLVGTLNGLGAFVGFGSRAVCIATM